MTDYRSRVKRQPAEGPVLLSFLAQLPPPEDGDTWGDWRLSTTEPPSLDYVGGYYKHCPYEIVLSDLFGKD